MFKVIRETNIGTWDEPCTWGAVMKECDTREKANEYIKEQPRWATKRIKN